MFPWTFPLDHFPLSFYTVYDISLFHHAPPSADLQYIHTHTTLFAIKDSNNKKCKKTNKTKKKKRNKPLQDKSNTTGQHNSILGLIFSTQSTNDIIGYGELAQKIKFSITYTHRSGLPLRCTKFIEVDRLVPIFKFSFQQLGNVLGVE